MEKILIGLFVPAAEERYDIFVPADLDIAALTRILADSVEELCNGRFCCSNQEMLVRKDPDTLLDPSRALSDYGIRDGTQIVLI